MPTRLVALLRGVNVGRNKRIAMAQLRDLLAGLGHTGVSTYLQSGNALFSSASADTAAVAAGIEQAIARDLKVECTVIVRTAAGLAAVVAANPLLDQVTDPARHLVGFLSGDPGPAGMQTVAALDVAPDQVRLLGRELYLWCPSGVLASPLSKVAWDGQLGVAVTMRNWSTVTRLASLASA